MNRLDIKFQELQKSKAKAFIAYITAGDPELETTLDIMNTFKNNGVDIIELGVPFTDPVGDGAVNQKAAYRAIASNTTLAKILTTVKKFRKNNDTPLVLFSYMNPLITYGIDKFAEDAVKAGIDAVLCVDAPFDMNKKFEKQLSANDIYCIYLASITTSDKRLKEIVSHTKGFLYYISSLGVTGTRKTFDKKLPAIIKKAKKMAGNIPVCVGFGISTPDDAKKIAAYADGVIVGSAFVKIIEMNSKNKEKMLKELNAFSKNMVKAVKAK